MRLQHIVLSVVALGSVASMSQAQQAVPERPSLWREVTGIRRDANNVALFQRPHIPGLRTTPDGRIGMYVKVNGPIEFVVMLPEQLNNPPMLQASDPLSNALVVRSYTEWQEPVGNFYGSPALDGVVHACLWSDELGPKAVGDLGLEKDEYNFKVIVTTRDLANMDSQFWVTPVTLTVTNPKTAQAVISDVVTGTPLAGPVKTIGSSTRPAVAFEPTVVGDGRLIVFRVGSDSLTWKNPQTGVVTTQPADIVYSYYDNSTESASPKYWNEWIPITYAHLDTRINDEFGFAMNPFRDTAGNIIPSSEDLGGTYPWMDREARNLFFTTIDDELHHSGNGWADARYPSAVPTPLSEYPNDSFQPLIRDNTRGVAFAGLWSRGKTILLDSLLNDMDYGLNPTASPRYPQQRLVTLFQSGPGGSGDLFLGYGRANTFTPDGDNANTTIIDSLENKLNYSPHMSPLRFRDVVWTVNNGKQTDEVIFDDYLDLQAMIVANMAGHLSWVDEPGTLALNSFQHHTSWDEGSDDWDPMNMPVRFQNAATTPDSIFDVPEYGEVVGNGRLEPAATGGLYGRGFWLDTGIGLEFEVPVQAQSNLDDRDWYVGLFVDCRFTDDPPVERQLLMFPDGSQVRLNGRQQVLFVDQSQNIVHRANLPETIAGATLEDLLPEGAWAHLGLQITENGQSVTLLLNGFPLSRWQDPDDALFQAVSGGKYTVGTAGPTGAANDFIGWIDDFKVLAHTVDPETAANHAGGTLIGFDSGYSGMWRGEFADRYPDWAHAQLSEYLVNSGEAEHDFYAVFHDYTADNSVHRGSLPTAPPGENDPVHLRAAIQFPEGPLFKDAPRPPSVTNTLCFTCHDDTFSDKGLTTAALKLTTDLAAVDPRRQPSQPGALIHGVIPAYTIATFDGTTAPSTGFITPAAGSLVDEWMLDSYSGTANVESFTLVDSDTMEDLVELTPGLVVDPAKLGTDTFIIRANLDSAQGSVDLTYDTDPPITRDEPPYALFEAVGQSLVGQVLTSGSHTVDALPIGGTTSSVTFTVQDPNVVRTIATYQGDFREGSPADGWYYCWNSTNGVYQPWNYEQLNWNETGAMPVFGLKVYNPRAQEFPQPILDGNFASLHSQGGWPGRQGNPGQGIPEQHVLTGYKVKRDGQYKIENLDVQIFNPVSTGLAVRVFTEEDGVVTNKPALGSNLIRVFYTGGSTTLAMPTSVYLEKGDIIWIAVSPLGNDSGDRFDWDFDINFREGMTSF